MSESYRSRLHRGPTPSELLRDELVGLRSPVTKPRGPAALVEFDSHRELRIDYDRAVRQAVVVDDGGKDGSHGLDS